MNEQVCDTCQMYLPTVLRGHHECPVTGIARNVETPAPLFSPPVSWACYDCHCMIPLVPAPIGHVCRGAKQHVPVDLDDVRARTLVLCAPSLPAPNTALKMMNGLGEGNYVYDGRKNTLYVPAWAAGIPYLTYETLRPGTIALPPALIHNLHSSADFAFFLAIAGTQDKWRATDLLFYGRCARLGDFDAIKYEMIVDIALAGTKIALKSNPLLKEEQV